MRISFDLDDTLICYASTVPREPRLGWWLRWWAGQEPLRAGAPRLLRALAARGWEVWIYTTSHRRPAVVRRWLWCHGVTVAGVINQSIHEQNVPSARSCQRPSKHPGAFGIALHVDDSEGVRQEGEQHGFRVVVVSPHDADWVDVVLRAVESLPE